MTIELFTEYRYGGRGTAHAVVVPIEERGDEIVVTQKSVGATRRIMDRDKLETLIENNLMEEDVTKTLVKQSELDPDLCKRMDEFLQENDGNVGRDDWIAHLQEVKRDLGLA